MSKKKRLTLSLVLINMLILIIFFSIRNLDTINCSIEMDDNRLGFQETKVFKNQNIKEEFLPQSMYAQQNWRYKTRSEIEYLSPLVVDLTNNGYPEVIMASEEGEVICLNHWGEEDWTANINGKIKASPTAGDLNHDGKLEIIIGNSYGDIYIIFPRYHESLQGIIFRTNSSFSSSPVIIDIDNDKNLDIIIGSEDGIVYCLEGFGEIKWQYQLSDSIILSSPAVADIDNDGLLEVLIGSHDNRLYCFDYKGSLKWNYTTDDWIHSSPAIADLDDDGKQEVIICSYDNNVYCLNYLGEPLWIYNTEGDIVSSPAIADLDDDGLLEIVVGSMDGKVHCINYTGGNKWDETFDTNYSFYASPAIANLDSDDTLEIIIGCWDKRLYCIDHLGQEEWNYSTNGEILSSAAIVDINKDGFLDIIFGSNDYYVRCLELKDSSLSGNQQWYSFRGSIFHTGQMDSDCDYLDDAIEDFYKSNPYNSDTDGDELLDGVEVLFFMTNPTKTDSDEDGIPDNEEVYEGDDGFITDPNNVDSDDDGLTDSWEVQNNHDPTKWDNWAKRFGRQFIPVYLVFIGLVVGFSLFLRKKAIDIQDMRINSILEISGEGRKRVTYKEIIERLKFKSLEKFLKWFNSLKFTLPITLGEKSVIIKQELPEKTSTDKITILIIEAKPKKLKILADLGKITRAITTEFEFVGLKNKIETKVAGAVSADNLSLHLMKNNPDIVHFIGYTTKEGKIVLYSEESGDIEVEPTVLAALFNMFVKSIRCVVLSSCYTKEQADEIAKYIDCVIGTPNTIKRKAAINFTKGFYRALGHGKNMKDAMKSGETQMKLLGGKGKPQICAKKVNPKDVKFDLLN